MDYNCPIRYIITVNALKEGWDCPFAYILASLANRTSPIDVEQILGRILRRPFTKNFSDDFLNMSYVFTSSENFRNTLEKIVAGLNATGFSEKEYRAVDDSDPLDSTDTSQENQQEQTNIFSESASVSNDNSTAKENFSNSTADDFVSELERQAQEISEQYNAENTTNGEDIRDGEEKSKMKVFPMQDKFKDAQNILLPQFFYRGDTGKMFDGEHDEKVSQEMFRTKFSLDDKDTIINFDNLNYEIASLDIYDNEDFPRYKYLSDAEVKNFLEYFEKLTPEGQIRQCADKIAQIIDKSNNPPSQHIRNYVFKIVSTFDRERLRAAVQHSALYARKIKEKIDFLLDEYAKKNFMVQIDSKKIFAKPSFKLPAEISPIHFQRNLANSLYEAEEDVDNNLEHKVIAKLTALDNVLWWHRNRSKKGFCINGFINYYPDFIVQMKSGVILIVESKGEHLKNDDSQQKLELGNLWASKAGTDKFSYFMVFENNPLDGALSFDDFISCVKLL